ncbi:Adhesion G protein-coupled receptor L3 [Trichoplax sp. H2]|nr:Adhesion G protein-coupled receptor L3 [Trichoplax sp. H2]|eukprot:RDD46199.1 Adhesion G protein-coupled receptor L3 [Trichoplax sp. H2]
MGKLTYFIHSIALLLCLAIQIDATNFGIFYNTSGIFNDIVEFTCFFEGPEKVSLEWRWDADYAGISLYSVQPQIQENGIVKRVIRLKSDSAKAGPYRCTASTNATTSYANAIYNKDRDIQPVRPYVARAVQERTTLKIVTALSGSFKWFRRGKEVQTSSSINIQNNGKDIVFSSADAFNSGMYKCESSNAERNAWVNLVIQPCSAGTYSTSRGRCNGTCTCFNGGICDAANGKCICSPGFAGDNCEITCSAGYFGHNCDQRCPKGSCTSQVVCTRSPGGCTCVTGWKGNDCTDPCTAGTYGDHCKLTCDCPNGATCDIVNGACPKVPPKILVSESTSKLNIKEGEAALLRCFASGSPIPNITWSKQNRDITNSSSIYSWQTYHKLYVRVSYLYIPKTSLIDSSTYTCTASNNISNAQRYHMTLNVSSITVRPVTTATTITTASTNAITTQVTTKSSAPTEGTISSQWCPSTLVLGIRWDRTLIGKINSKPCPAGSTGTATWYCLSADYWSKSWPDLSQCKSARFTSLKNQANRPDSNSTLLAASLRLSTGFNQPVYGGDIVTAIEIYNRLLAKKRDEIRKTEKSSINNFLKDLIESSSSLIDPLHYNGWVGLKKAQRMALATNLMRVIDDIAFLWTNNTRNVAEANITIITKNIVVVSSKLRVNLPMSVTFPVTTNPASFASTLKVNLPLALATSGESQLAYAAYKQISNLLSEYIPGIDNKIRNNTSVAVDQKILGAIVSISTKPSLSLKFLNENPIIYIIKYTEATRDDAEKKCVYWDFSTSQAQGLWNNRGCSVVLFNSTHITCRCNHLTSFTVIETMRKNLIPQSLKEITIIGCSIATGAIVTALLILFSFRSQNTFMNHIRLNILFTLFVFELLCLFSIYQTKNKDVCLAMAVSINYFSLCTFFWIFISSFEIYRRTFHIMEKLKKRFCYIFAYAIPAITVVIAGFAASDNFGTDKFCWLRIGSGAFWLFVGEVLLLVVVSVIMCSRVMHEVSMRRRTEQENYAGSPRTIAQGSVISIILLIMTWTFAILYMREISTIMAVLYLILNSILGIFLFVFYTVVTGPMHNICSQFWQSQILGTSGTVKFASTKRMTSPNDTARTDDKATYVTRNTTENFHESKGPYASYTPNDDNVNKNTRYSKESGNNKITNL